MDLFVTIRTTFAVISDEELFRKLEILSITTEATVILITDAVLMYRCWLVYAKSWYIIALPLMLWSTGVACVILFDHWLIVEFSTLSQLPLFTLFTPQTRRFAAVFFCCSFVNNVYATCAISYRILHVARSDRSSSLYVACRVIAESGILCASTTLLMLITSAILNGLCLPAVLFDVINFSTMGIAFNLILIRVGKQRAKQPHRCESTQKTVYSVETEGAIFTDAI